MNLLIVLALLGCGGNPAAEDISVEVKEKAEVAQAAAAVVSDWTHYGEAFTVEKSVPATGLLGSPATYVDETIRVTGRVADVCQKAGCWMVLAEEEKLMRVIMKDHAFAVDKGGAGGEADIEGLVVAKAIDPKEVEHYRGESQHPDKIPEAKVTEPTTYELVASAVSMRK